MTEKQEEALRQACLRLEKQIPREKLPESSVSRFAKTRSFITDKPLHAESGVATTERQGWTQIGGGFRKNRTTQD